MLVFTIQVAPHKGKHIHVTSYVMTAVGIDLRIEHNVPAIAGKQLQWVQTVLSNNDFSRTCKMMTRVDPFGVGVLSTRYRYQACLGTSARPTI